MTHDYVAYIDEAGDEGFGKLGDGPVGGQSRWLILGACIATRADDLKFPAWRDQIVSRFPNRKRRDLHFRDLKHPQKIVACQELAKLPVGICLTFSHKVTIPGSEHEQTFKKEGYLYNWLVRWLLERLTTHCTLVSRKQNCSLRIVFSRRSNTNYQTMMEYLQLMKDQKEVVRPTRRINWDVLDIAAVGVENHSKWAGLQLADCATSAFFAAVEPNVYGNYEQGYANQLRERLIADAKGNVLNCGLTVVPSAWKCDADPQQDAFFRSFIKK